MPFVAIAAHGLGAELEEAPAVFLTHTQCPRVRRINVLVAIATPLATQRQGMLGGRGTPSRGLHFACLAIIADGNPRYVAVALTPTIVVHVPHEQGANARRDAALYPDLTRTWGRGLNGPDRKGQQDALLAVFRHGRGCMCKDNIGGLSALSDEGRNEHAAAVVCKKGVLHEATSGGHRRCQPWRKARLELRN